MKFDLEATLKALGWSLGLVAVFSAVLALFGVQLDTVLLSAGSMLGAQALISLAVDVGKWAGVVKDGTAGIWSAVLNLLGLAAISYALITNPAFDFPALDAQLVTIAQFGSLIFGYIVQIAGAKHFHRGYVQGLGVKAFAKSSA